MSGRDMEMDLEMGFAGGYCIVERWCGDDNDPAVWGWTLGTSRWPQIMRLHLKMLSVMCYLSTYCKITRLRAK